MEGIGSIVVQLIGGGIGGNITGQVAKRLTLGALGNSIAGAIGGVMLAWIVARIPGFDGLVGTVPAAAPGMAGQLDVGALAGQGIVAIVGGVVLAAITGAIKNAKAK